MRISVEENRNTKAFFYSVTFSFAFAAFMVRMDGYIVNICLPTMARYFQAGTGAISLVVLAYMLVLTSTMLAMGSLGDRFGLKRLILTGYAVFTIGSFFCGFSSSLAGLVLSRGLQGLGGAMLITAGFAIIPRFLPKEMTGWAFGIIATATSLGILVGAPLGSYIAAYLSWHWIFYINVPLGVVAFWFTWRILPDDGPAASATSPSFDAIGAVLSVIALITFTMTVVARGKGGWLIPVVCVLSFAAFILNEKRHASPLLDLGLFRNKIFAWANLMTFLMMSVLAGLNFLFPFYLEVVQGLAVSMSCSVVHAATGCVNRWRGTGFLSHLPAP
jgi:MFS family permease